LLPRRSWADVAAIRVGTPNLGDRAQLHRLLDEILDRAWLTNHGPLEREFEARLCEVVGTRHCIPVANATLGLLVAVKALVPDGEVIMPAFTFPAAAHVTRMLGLEPVFCDIDPHRHHLDPRDVAGRLTDRTAGVVAVHLWGRACDTEELEHRVADRPVIYDAAHAFGATHRGRPIGSNGRCEVFSFHATKLVTSFEGGAIATNDDELAERLRLLINFGFVGRDQVVAAGINAKLSEIHAAMGIVSLDLLSQILAANTANLEQYRVRLAELPGVRLMTEPDSGNSSYVVVEIDEQVAARDRDATMAYLRARGIDTRRYFYPGVHCMEPYRRERTGGTLPVTEAVCKRVLQLPTGLAMDEGRIDDVCRTLSEAVGRS
jgi:dTDP-4-amino-4,6-dideoxygalactose transaminase